MSSKKTETLKDRMALRGFYPLRPLAARLAMSPFTLYTWAKTEKIRTTKVGSRTYVYLPSLAKVIGTEACKAAGLALPLGVRI
jgi:hypothetical protein